MVTIANLSLGRLHHLWPFGFDKLFWEEKKLTQPRKEKKWEPLDFNIVVEVIYDDITWKFAFVAVQIEVQQRKKKKKGRAIVKTVFFFFF